VLPALLENQTQSLANDINNSGRIVGETTMNQPDRTLQLATVWDNGQVADLNTLIHPDDPLRAYVTLTTGTLINDRGEIVAQGADSRVGYLQYYFLEPVHGH
jgi:probable HAF family extracellular repeat protein